MATRLGFNQVANLWVKAGGTPGWKWLAAGIATAESGRWPTAKNPTDHHTNGASGSWGLWQIGSTHGPGGYGTHDPTWLHQILTPLVNASYAVALSAHGSYWTPWSGDPVERQWWNAGHPIHPSRATVQGWVRTKTTNAITLTGPVVTPNQGTPYVANVEAAWHDLANWVMWDSVELAQVMAEVHNLITSA